MKIKIYCDSGANAHSRWEDTYDIEDLGLTEEEWNKLTDDQKDELIKPMAFDRLEWGYYPVDEK